MSERSIPLKAYLIFGFGLLCASVSSILVKYASEAPGVVVATWRTLSATLFLLPFLYGDRLKNIKAIKKKEWGLIVLAGVLLGFHFIVWIESFYHTSVASATVLVSTAPIFLAVLAYIFLKEKLPTVVWIGILVAVAGASLIGLSSADDTNFPTSNWGNALALTAALFVSLYLLVGRFLRQGLDWYSYVFPLFSVAALTVLATVLISGENIFGYSAQFYFVCFMIGLFPQIMGHGSFNYSVKYFPAAIIGVGGLIEPIIASAMAFFLFDEMPAQLAFLGMGIIIVSIAGVVISLERGSRDKA